MTPCHITFKKKMKNKLVVTEYPERTIIDIRSKIKPNSFARSEFRSELRKDLKRVGIFPITDFGKGVVFQMVNLTEYQLDKYCLFLGKNYIWLATGNDQFFFLKNNNFATVKGGTFRYKSQHMSLSEDANQYWGSTYLSSEDAIKQLLKGNFENVDQQVI
jgi:hypothetical protein